MMRSTDSVYPVLAAVHGQDFSVDHETRTPTPHSFLETYDLSDPANPAYTLIEKNIAFLGLQCRISELLRADL